MATFADLDNKLKGVGQKRGRNMSEKKVGNNTYAVRNTDGSIGLRLHKTQVVIFYQDGRVTLHTGGWRSVTTKARINEWIPGAWRVAQTKGQWGLWNTETKEERPFVEGMKLPGEYLPSPESPVTALAIKMNPKAFGYSPRMAALLGAVLGHDYGARDSRGGHITSLAITSDGFVVGASTASDGGAFLGTVADLARNLALLVADANLTPEETALFTATLKDRVTDYSGHLVKKND